MEKQVALRGKDQVRNGLPRHRPRYRSRDRSRRAAVHRAGVQRYLQTTCTAQLPMPTADPGKHFKHYGEFFPIVLVSLVLLPIGFRYLITTPTAGSCGTQRKLKVPIFGELARKTAVSRFASTFSALLRAGVPVLESLEITREHCWQRRGGQRVDAISTVLRGANRWPRA